MTERKTEYDVVILQATPAGICSAIAAARRGCSVLILERTAFIGGLPANGLGATDIATRGCAGGLFKEFVDRVKRYYVDRYGAESREVQDCDHGYHFEPHVAEQTFNQMLEEHKDLITVLRNWQFDVDDTYNIMISEDSIQYIKAVMRNGEDAETFNGKFWIDASYEGDLIAAAHVPFFLGREGKHVYNEPGAGRVYKKWRGSESNGTTHQGDNAVQAYNYRLCLTNRPDNMAPFTKPTDYRRDEYVSMIEDIKLGLHTCHERPASLTFEQKEANKRRAEQGIKPEPHSLPGIVRLCSNVKLPRGKVDANNQHLAFISTDLPEENWPYPTSGWAWRDRFALRQRHYTEGLLYFAQNDPEVPAWFREELKPWGWAKDEYPENGHFPRQLYVREGRRMKGVYVFTAHDSLPDNDGDAPFHADTVTATHYPLDSHAARKREPNRVHLDGFISYPNVPYTVPYRVMVPTAHPGRTPVRNLLAPVPCSASHIGFSTLRMEPCWMALGHAAGIAAAMSVKTGISAANLNVAELQSELLKDDATLVWNPELKNCETSEERVKLQCIVLMSNRKSTI